MGNGREIHVAEELVSVLGVGSVPPSISAGRTIRIRLGSNCIQEYEEITARGWKQNAGGAGMSVSAPRNIIPIAISEFTIALEGGMISDG